MAPAVVLAGSDRQGSFAVTIGCADIDTLQPIAPEDSLYIASISKWFSSMLIHQLAEESKVAYDDPLAEYLPEFPRASEVTLRMLLDHTSGVASVYDSGSGAQLPPDQPVTLEKAVSLMAEAPFHFSPGTQVEYTNSGPILAARVAEVVTGQPYAELMRARIFEPLGLQRTGIAPDVRPTVTGHYRVCVDNVCTQRKGRDETRDLSLSGPAAALVAAPLETARMAQAFFDGTLLSRERALLASEQSLGPENNFGLGPQRSHFGNRVLWGHGGNGFGMESYAGYELETDTSIVIQSNVQALDIAFPLAMSDLLSGTLDTLQGGTR